MLLSGHAEVTGGDSVETGVVVRVRHGAQSVVGVVGRPPADAIARALDNITDMTPLLAQVGNAEYIQRSLDGSRPERWSGEAAIMHALPTPDRTLPALRPSPDASVRLLTLADPLDHLSPGLRHEMTHARLLGPVGAAFADGVPVSFCYPVWVTESLWDVSIDTVETHRRRSLAASAVAFMVDHMRREGREPVWGALASNTASLRLAAKLGFARVGEIVVFSKGQWAYLTGGF
jgi:RimJ/RimL family protein N-acetyltransferase